MERISIPATTFQVICPKCAKYTLYSVFFASFYDFKTCYGLKTKSLYRINMELVKYGVTTEEKAFSKIIDIEGGRDSIITIPENIECKHCLNIFSPEKLISSGYEERVLAYVI